jgi:hypothetical protein
MKASVQKSRGEEDHLEDPGVDGWTLKWTLRTGWEGVDWMQLAQVREQ